MKRIKLDSIASTNSFISELIKTGKGKEDVVVTAEYQIDGKGQGDHVWHSQKGKNLLMSLLLHPAFLSASEQFKLSKMISLSICDALESEGIMAIIKWPNDILTDKGKIAGILIEHGISGGKISHTVLGIGLNLNQTTFPDFHFSASSYVIEKGISIKPDTMAAKLLEKFSIRYNMLEEDHGRIVDQDYDARLHMNGKTALFLIHGEECPGLIRGVNKFGELQVEIDGNINSFGHQEIKYLGPGS